jgi:hypothetical protein
MLTYASRTLSFIIALMATRLRLALIKNLRKWGNRQIYMIAPHSANVIAPIILPPVWQSSRLFFTTLAYHLSTIPRARDGNYFSSLVAFAFAVTMAPPHAPFILAAYVPVFDRCTQNGTRSQSVDPFTSELSFFAAHTHTHAKASNCRQINSNH